MIPYKNLKGNSGVKAYETGPDYIKIKFKEGSAYTYSYASAGRKIIEKMKVLARKGEGLSTYISQTVKDKFEH